MAAGASEVALQLNLLSAPKMLIVFGATGVWFKKTTGPATQKTYCDPFGVESKSTGLDFATIYLGNDGASEAEVTIVAIE